MDLCIARLMAPLSFSLSVPTCRHLPWLMTQQMQNLQLSQTRKCPGGPASPSAAKRLYRNLSEKLRGSTSSFEDAYFFSKTDRLRKASVSEEKEEIAWVVYIYIVCMCVCVCFNSVNVNVSHIE